MLRFIGRLAVYMLVGLVLPVAILLAVGQGRALAPPSYPGAAACALPCWAGITPDHTRTEDAYALLAASLSLEEAAFTFRQITNEIRFEAAAEQPVSGVIYDDRGVIAEVQLMLELPLGWLVAELDSPQCARSTQMLDGRDIVQLSWVTEDYYIGATTILPQTETLQPATRTTVLSLSRAYPICEATTQHPWQGFAPAWRYASPLPGS